MMTRRNNILLLLIFVVFSGVVEGVKRGKISSSPENGSREGKLFSLFNVVQFQNTACVSQLKSSATNNIITEGNTNPVSGSNRAGTCYSSSECISKGGQSQGSCAAGFGVCCVFLNTGGTVNQNCTYLTNSGFPSGYSATSGVTYTINKCTQNVCSLRLDFDTFNILGPDAVETGGGACRDTLTITSSSRTLYPTICGSNSGQHVYVDIGRNGGDTATLTFAFPGTASTTRTWDIKVTQVKCGTSNPPAGCFQYFTGTSGRISTFNFADGTTTHLANQAYTSCIRQTEGFCCVQYQPCADATGAFSINEQVPMSTLGLTDSRCSQDFIQISGATSNCASGGDTSLVQTSRICGTLFTLFNGVVKGVASVPICDCTQPFDISFYTNAAADLQSAAILSRGVCLDYQQIPC